LHRQRHSTPCGPARVRPHLYSYVYFSEGHMSGSIPPSGKYATCSAFSGLRKCRHSPSNPPYNTRFCTTPLGYQRDGLFPVITAIIVLIFFILSPSFPCLTACLHLRLCLLLCCHVIFAVFLLFVTLRVKGTSATCYHSQWGYIYIRNIYPRHHHPSFV
jgi:hypothetical protein